MLMMPLQCRMARAALNLSNSDLAGMAKVGVNTVSRFEQGQDVRQSSVQVIQAALESAGVEFVGAGQSLGAGGPGVRLRSSAIKD